MSCFVATEKGRSRETVLDILRKHHRKPKISVAPVTMESHKKLKESSKFKESSEELKHSKSNHSNSDSKESFEESSKEKWNENKRQWSEDKSTYFEPSLKEASRNVNILAFDNDDNDNDYNVD